MTNFKNNLLISEGTYDSSSILDKYFTKIGKELLKRYSKKEIGNFTFDVDQMSGTWMWANDEISVYATLGWENQDELPIDTENINIKSKICKVSKLSFDINKDIKMYMSAVIPALKKLK